MRCPTLSELPPPPLGRAGWPWTVECTQIERGMYGGQTWPSISIVTPSYNQGGYIEETIRSVLLQGYPDIEYIIIDGGSTDDTIDIIHKYEKWISFWQSENDSGQANAINKGLSRSNGEIFQWINSDDVLSEYALKFVALSMVNGVSSVAGGVRHFGVVKEDINFNRALDTRYLISWLSFHSSQRKNKDIVFDQPGIFLRTKLIRELGGLSEEFHYVFDLEFLARYFFFYPSVCYLNQEIVKFRHHLNSKTVATPEKFREEYFNAIKKIKYSINNSEVSNIVDDILKTRNREIQLNADLNKLKFSPHLIIYNLSKIIYLFACYRDVYSARFFIGYVYLIIKRTFTH